MDFNLCKNPESASLQVKHGGLINKITKLNNAV